LSPDRIYLELRLTKSLRTDEHGNWIIEAEASNENLDFDGQIVLQRALTGSKDYFLQNGVISYDHRHLKPDTEDPTWSPEKYIIGEPISVTADGTRTIVKAKLYKSNEIAQEIVKKLQDGSTRLKTSVGGRMPQVVKEWTPKLGKAVEKVVSVLWDELAITFKPVNQSLSPVILSGAQLVKALSAGYGTDSASMTGGRALIPEDLQKKHTQAVVAALATGSEEPEDAELFLKNRGCSPEEATEILDGVISNKHKHRKEVARMDTKLAKAFDDSIEALEKAMKKGKKAMPPIEEDEGYPDMPPPEAMAEDMEDEEPDGDEYAPPPRPMKKSIYEDVNEDAGDFLDVAPFLSKLTKSISNQMSEMQRAVSNMASLQKSLAAATIVSGKMLKSLADVPSPRQAVVNRLERTFVAADGRTATMSKKEILEKSQALVQAGTMSLNEFGKIEERLNKGIPISDEALRLIKAM